jgi:glutathione S-transferase
MATLPLTLYGESFWISPYVFSAFVALREKQLPFTVTPIALGSGDQRRGPYYERAFTGKVPALAHGDAGTAGQTIGVDIYGAGGSYLAPANPNTIPVAPELR